MGNFSPMKEAIRTVLKEALERLGLDDVPASAIEVDVPKRAEFGDYTTNAAMVLAKRAGMEPRRLAERVAAELERSGGDLFKAVEVQGPGFINFFVRESAITSALATIRSQGERYGRARHGEGRRVLVEFVSANPTGYLHMGHARNAAVGDAVASLLEAVGYEVTREFYINDAGRQVEMLGRSVYARYLQLFGREATMPEDGYMGDYVVTLAEEVRQKWGERYLEVDENAAVEELAEYAKDRLLDAIKETLRTFGVEFDVWYSEKRDLVACSAGGGGRVGEVLVALASKGATYAKDGAVWFKATAYGDSQDWVLVKSDGSHTYFLNDIAYHLDKVRRGFDTLINVWGADHHSHVTRLKAALKALCVDDDRLRVVLIQFVRLMRRGEEVKMSKRAGSFVTMNDVMAEVGSDVMRFFLLMRSADTHLDFDLELAKEQSSENPVYYVQYANARINSVKQKAAERGIGAEGGETALLIDPMEVALTKKLLSFPEVIDESARALAPHKVVYYLLDVASDFHVYYNRVRIITEDDRLTRARLFFIDCVQHVIRNGLKILGVSVPDRM